MNFLAHTFLSQRTPEALAGALLGDCVHGSDLSRFPGEVAQAIRLHRAIDVFTDDHAVVRRSRRRLGTGFHLLRPLLIDIFYDHFLARDFPRYSVEPLGTFTLRVYAGLTAQAHLMPPRQVSMVTRMAEGDWLAAYANLDNVALALRGTSARLRRATNLAQGSEALRASYAPMGEDFHTFFPELQAMVANWLARGGT